MGLFFLHIFNMFLKISWLWKLIKTLLRFSLKIT